MVCIYVFKLNLLEILDLDSGNASKSFKKMKEESSNTVFSVPTEYLKKDTRRKGKSNLSISDAPFIDIRLKEERQIVYSVFKSILSSQYPYIFITIKFSLFDDKTGKWLDKKDAASRYDKYEVERTNRLCRNMLRECFDVNEWYAFRERHEAVIMPNGTVKDGRFHTHALIPAIDDKLIIHPNRKCRRLLNEYKEWIDYASPSPSVLKEHLIKACILKADWIKRWENQIDIKKIYTEEDLANVVCYCLKTYTNHQSDIDFNDVICNSSTFNH